nr:hypothetical protein [Tanacetum cinerariifolium]
TIQKLEDRVDQLEEDNRALKEKSFKTTQVDIAAPVKNIEKSFKQGRMISDTDEDVKDIDEEESDEVKEVLEVVKAAKLMIEVVTTAQSTTNVAQVLRASAPRRRRGVIIQDPEETAASVIVHTERMRLKKKEIKDKVKVLSKKQRMDEEAKELKRHLQIVANDDDDVFTEATPFSIKLVKERFENTEPKNFSDDFLLNILKIIFKKPNIEASIWKDQKGRYGLAKQMLDNVRLEVEEESKMSLELLRLVRRQLNEGYVPE